MSLNNDDNQLLGSLDCYCNAIAASPGEWLGYQNAGHCSIRLSWWEGSIWFHEAVRQLDHAYDSRAEADKCECLTHAKASLKAAKKRSYIRLWCFEDVTPPGFDLAQLNGEENIDPCWTARRTPQGSFILRVNGQPFEFESITKRQHALSGLVAICREKEARRALEAMSTSAISVHPVLRSDVLQHIMSFFTDDWKGASQLRYLLPSSFSFLLPARACLSGSRLQIVASRFLSQFSLALGLAAAQVPRRRAPQACRVLGTQECGFLWKRRISEASAVAPPSACVHEYSAGSARRVQLPFLGRRIEPLQSVLCAFFCEKHTAKVASDR